MLLLAVLWWRSRWEVITEPDNPWRMAADGWIERHSITLQTRACGLDGCSPLWYEPPEGSVEWENDDSDSDG